MLTADLAMSWRRGRSTGPRYLKADDPNYLQTADGLIDIVRRHRGSRRAELDESLQEFVGTGTDYKILRGLIKLILDRCLFETAGSRDPVEIRRALFLKARLHHPVTESESARHQTLTEAAMELSATPEELIAGLYGDLPENQRLIDFEELDARELLDRYNLAQAQALLYRSVEMHLQVEPQEAHFNRQLFEAIKAYRLIHTIRGNADSGYEIRLGGPVSIFHRSQKYGVQMAVFLPALLACEGWSMRAEIDLKSGESAFFELDSRQTRLHSYFFSETMDASPVAEKLVAKWANLESEWTLEQCREVIDLGESAFVPDFTFIHSDGKRAYLEILGFWTPRYLVERLKELERGGFKDFILAVSNDLRGSRDEPTRLPANVVTFKTVLDAASIESVLERL